MTLKMVFSNNEADYIPAETTYTISYQITNQQNTGSIFLKFTEPTLLDTTNFNSLTIDTTDQNLQSAGSERVEYEITQGSVANISLSFQTKHKIAEEFDTTNLLSNMSFDFYDTATKLPATPLSERSEGLYVSSTSNYAQLKSMDFRTATWENLVDSRVITIFDNQLFNFDESKILTEQYDLVISDSITSLGYSALDQLSGLRSVKFGNGITKWEETGITNCNNLTSIYVPASVTQIGSSPIHQCLSLTTIIVDPNNTVYDSRNNCNAIIETATNTLIAGCKNTIIPDTVTIIGEYAFFGCRDLTEITLPSNMTSIEKGALEGCIGLTSITIPACVTSIGDATFSACANLTSITFAPGSQLTSIGEIAFAVSGLISITIPASVTSIGDGAFWWCESLTSVTFEDTTGWYVGTTPDTINTAIPSEDLAHASTAATYLENTYAYAFYWWKKIVD